MADVYTHATWRTIVQKKQFAMLSVVKLSAHVPQIMQDLQQLAVSQVIHWRQTINYVKEHLSFQFSSNKFI